MSERASIVERALLRELMRVGANDVAPYFCFGRMLVLIPWLADLFGDGFVEKSFRMMFCGIQRFSASYVVGS